MERSSDTSHDKTAPRRATTEARLAGRPATPDIAAQVEGAALRCSHAALVAAGEVASLGGRAAAGRVAMVAEEVSKHLAALHGEVTRFRAALRPE